MTIKSIERSIPKLSPAERIYLIESLVASLDQPDPTIERAWAKESDKRLAAYKKGSLKGTPLESIKKYFIK